MSVTANKLIQRQEHGRNCLPVAASKHLYQGTLAYIDSNGNVTDVTANGANAFAGIVKEEVDNSSGAAGDLNVELLTSGAFVLVGAGTYTQADVGKDVFGTDNYTIVVADSSTAVRIGKSVGFVSGTELAVLINVGGFVQGAALTAADGGTVDGTYGAAEAAVISNNVVRIGEIESRLKALGLIA